MPRDTTLVLTVVVTVDSLQADNVIVNRAIIINPVTYALPIVDGDCPLAAEASCALTMVPPTPRFLGSTGAEISFGAIGASVLALLLGSTLLFVRRRRVTA